MLLGKTAEVAASLRNLNHLITQYWSGGGHVKTIHRPLRIDKSIPSGIPDDGTDFGAISENYVSITPLDLDLTEYRRMMQLRTWSWEDVPETEPESMGIDPVPETEIVSSSITN